MRCASAPCCVSTYGTVLTRVCVETLPCYIVCGETWQFSRRPRPTRSKSLRHILSSTSFLFLTMVAYSLWWLCIRSVVSIHYWRRLTPNIYVVYVFCIGVYSAFFCWACVLLSFVIQVSLRVYLWDLGTGRYTSSVFCSAKFTCNWISFLFAIHNNGWNNLKSVRSPSWCCHSQNKDEML